MKITLVRGSPALVAVHCTWECRGAEERRRPARPALPLGQHAAQLPGQGPLGAAGSGGSYVGGRDCRQAGRNSQSAFG